MRLFKCQNCGQVLYFENSRCENCGYRLGFLPEKIDLSALTSATDNWHALADGERAYRFCANAEHEACNWLVPAESAETFCLACRHNRTVPDLSAFGNRYQWQKVEAAKHRLFYALLRWGLPIKTKREAPEDGLAFDFLADPPQNEGQQVMTGHDDGLITLALAEADDAERERRRAQMGEPYRTLLGHFRHEIGHYYWDRLVRDGGRPEECRALFGDDRQDYGQAIERHYKDGPPQDWQQNFVSTYATMHPWEDFAETWAHYLHIVDTLEMAYATGLQASPRIADTATQDVAVTFDPYETGTIEQIVHAWLPLTYALNSLNRCMGQSDTYPFVLSPAIINKLGFIHALVRDYRAGKATPKN